LRVKSILREGGGKFFHTERVRSKKKGERLVLIAATKKIFGGTCRRLQDAEIREGMIFGGVSLWELDREAGNACAALGRDFWCLDSHTA